MVAWLALLPLFLPLFKLFSTNQPEGSCSNETSITLLPAQSLPKVSRLTQSKIMHEPSAQTLSHVQLFTTPRTAARHRLWSDIACMNHRASYHLDPTSFCSSRSPSAPLPWLPGNPTSTQAYTPAWHHFSWCSFCRLRSSCVSSRLTHSPPILTLYFSMIFMLTAYLRWPSYSLFITLSTCFIIFYLPQYWWPFNV